LIIPRTDQPAMDVSDIKGLVIIDLWKDIPIIDEWAARNNEKLNLDAFQSVIVANYELKLDSDDICQHNVLQHYSWTNFTPNILLSMVKYCRSCRTHPWIQNQLTDRSFLILEPEDMKHHVQNIAPHIQDWLVIGWCWRECTHTRPIGFYNMRFMPYNFYVTNWSMVGVGPDSVEHLQKDRLRWIDYGNNLFQLEKYAR